jgi:hypothetical protein
MLEDLQTRSRRRTWFFDLVAQEGDFMSRADGFLKERFLLQVPLKIPPCLLLTG